MRALEGKVSLVTGASPGIGRAIAVELARNGARVALNYKNGELQAREVAEEIVSLGGAAILAKADVAQSEQARGLIGRVVAKWGRIDILVNNAGITRDKTLRNLCDDEWLAVINTNLNGAFYCTSAAVPVMIEQKYGRIVNISSVIGQSGNVGQSNYSAAKAGVIAFTKSASLELAKYNITVNAVCPGFTSTDMLADVPENVQAQIRTKIPLGRFAKPEEIAKAVLFLALHGDCITGQQINVNGGLYTCSGEPERRLLPMRPGCHMERLSLSPTP